MGVLRDMLRHWPRRVFAPAAHLRAKYEAFKGLLDADEKALVLMAELEEVVYGQRCVDPARVQWLCRRLLALCEALAGWLMAMNPGPYRELEQTLARIGADIERFFVRPDQSPDASGAPLVLNLAQALARPDQAGGKAANLARAAAAGLAVPPALVVGVGAFRLFVEAGGLRPKLDRLLRQADLSSPDRLETLCAELRALVLETPLPQALAEALDAAATGPELAGTRLAVRSSALGEDGGLSFAGQYASELDVDPADLHEAYRRILAAKYRPRAVAYRLLTGLADDETPMAVLLMPMIAARAAGALFSREAVFGGRVAAPGGGEAVAVFALAGLGDRLMSGQDDPRALYLLRREPTELLDDSGQGPVELGQDALDALVRAALALEELFGCPQEVEWALDQAGRLFVLQSRPHSPEPIAESFAVAQGRGLEGGPEPLAKGLDRVAPGTACGPVFHLRDLARLAEVPAGAVLAVQALSPALGKGVGRVEAVLAASGSRASHFASVAREFGLPVLAGAGELLERLAEGEVVSVDADAGAVYPGRVEALLAGRGQRREALRAAVRERYDALARLVCKLGLTDPEAEDFTPRGCRSLHDMVRYCHERAVAEMFSLADRSGRGLNAARRLESSLPLSMYVLDLGDGLRPDLGPGETLRPEDFAGEPMRAFWQGLAHADENWEGTGLHFDWEEFDRISAGIFRKDSHLLASYALVSADYLHLLVRFGYHFAVLDSMCGQRAEANYIGLRFKGGGGLEAQRLLRLGFIRRVLSACGFSVNTRGDMLDARLARADEKTTVRRLTLLGRLLARTRLMDMRLTDEAQARLLADEFLSGLAPAD